MTVKQIIFKISIFFILKTVKIEEEIKTQMHVDILTDFLWFYNKLTLNAKNTIYNIHLNDNHVLKTANLVQTEVCCFYKEYCSSFSIHLMWVFFLDSYYPDSQLQKESASQSMYFNHFHRYM